MDTKMAALLASLTSFAGCMSGMPPAAALSNGLGTMATAMAQPDQQQQSSGSQNTALGLGIAGSAVGIATPLAMAAGGPAAGAATLGTATGLGAASQITGAAANNDPAAGVAAGATLSQGLASTAALASAARGSSGVAPMPPGGPNAGYTDPTTPYAPKSSPADTFVGPPAPASGAPVDPASRIPGFDQSQTAYNPYTPVGQDRLSDQEFRERMNALQLSEAQRNARNAVVDRYSAR